MILPKCYELWNGKEVVGYYSSSTAICGKKLSVPELSALKEFYGKQKVIEVEIATRIISDNGVDVHFRYVLDVRKKSKRQIDILNNTRWTPSIG